MYIMRITVVPSIQFTGNILSFRDPATGLTLTEPIRRVATFPLIEEAPITLNIPDNPVREKFKEYEKVRTPRQLASFIGGVYIEGRIMIGNVSFSEQQARNIALQKFRPDNRERLYINREIRQKLIELIKDRIQYGMDNDIGGLVDEAGSPPVLIEQEDGWFENQDEWSKEHTTARFSVVKDNPYIQRLTFGNERVWRLNASKLNTITTFYEHKNKDLTCAYDYIVNRFSNVSSFKKLSQNKQTIDRVIENPTTEAQQIFDEWSKLYWDEFNNTNKNDEIHPLPEYISTDEIEDEEWFKINALDFNTDWLRKDDEKETLSVIDIVKWCIRAKVRLNVIDHNNEFYLAYNPQMFKARYGQQLTNTRTISMIVKYNHAYFITDTEVHNYLSAIHNNYTEKTTDFILTKKVEKEEKEKEGDEQDEVQRVQYVLPPTPETPWSHSNIDKHPPPTLDRLKSMMDGKEMTHYYVDKSNLNGLVNILYKTCNIVPKSLSGGCHSVHSATYDKLKIYSNKRRPPNPEQLGLKRENLIQMYDKLWELYPKLQNHWGILPTDTKIADEVYEGLELDDIKSMLNSQMRKIFYENEIKADNRSINLHNSNPVFSIDFKRAYTTAMRNNIYKWNVFDSVCQPVKFNGYFRPDLFYLCYNKDDDFPLRGEGLVLYHGSLIQYVKDRVDIKYVLIPKKKLERDHFVQYLDKVVELEEDGVFNGITNSKKVVNNFIGNLKRRDGITDYKLWLIDNKNTAMREMMKGRFPSRMTERASFNTECLLVAKPKHQHHFLTAQPIRLQILEMINEQNYLLYLHYKKCLYAYKFVNLWQNDIKQRKILTKIRGKKSVIPKFKSKVDFNPSLVGVRTDALYLQSPIFVNSRMERERVDWEWIDKQVWDYRTQPKLDAFKKYLVDTWNDSNVYQILPESQMDGIDWSSLVRNNLKQIGIKYVPNEWNTDIDITHKWDKTYGSKAILTHAIQNGGCWISGKGGRGKSELILELDKMIERNNKKYRWMRAIYKSLYPDCYFHKLEEWRRKNPCKYRKFAPTNKASNRIGGKTLHKGLCIPIQDDCEANQSVDGITEEVTDGCSLEVMIGNFEACVTDRKHSLNVMVIDEISMVDGRIWSFLSYIKLRIPTITFLLMGDVKHQLKPVGEENRQFEHAYVIKELANFNKITLHYNFRTGQARDELWERCLEPQTINRQGEDTIRNLSYTHKKRKEVIDILQNKIVNPIVMVTPEEDREKEGHNDTLKFSWGTPLIARKSYSDRDIWKNEIYLVTGLDPIRLYEPERHKVVEVEKQELLRMFLSGFCITIHKSQSETYRDNYTIHEWDKISQSGNNFLRLRYVATSRSDDWENKVFIKP